MPNWTIWQWIFAAYITVGVTIALIAWIAGHKKAPDDAGTSKPEQRITTATIIAFPDRVRKEEN